MGLRVPGCSPVAALAELGLLHEYIICFLWCFEDWPISVSYNNTDSYSSLSQVDYFIIDHPSTTHANPSTPTPNPRTPTPNPRQIQANPPQIRANPYQIHDKRKYILNPRFGWGESG